MIPHRKNARFARPLFRPYQVCSPVADGEYQRVFADGTLSMAVHAIPNIEMLDTEMWNTEVSGTLAAGAFGQRGWRAVTERGHGGLGGFSDIEASGDVAEISGTDRIVNPVAVGHAKTQISPAADTDPGG